MFSKHKKKYKRTQKHGFVCICAYLFVCHFGCIEKNRGRKGSKRGAPRSPFAGIGKPRVSPEVAAADAKRKADSLKNVNFDVDLELFGDAGTMVGGGK